MHLQDGATYRGRSSCTVNWLSINEAHQHLSFSPTEVPTHALVLVATVVAKLHASQRLLPMIAAYAECRTFAEISALFGFS